MSLNISNRLKAIANQLAPRSIFADIGSDHAYLPCYVCLNDHDARAIAIEVANGPFNRASETVLQYGLGNRIEVRLGDGLQPITESDQIEEIVIAGMGGTLIATILQTNANKLTHINKLIVQPNNNEAKVRKILIQLQFILTKEIIIEENGLYYEILVAYNSLCNEYNNPYEQFIKEKQLIFGPYLLRERSPLFIEKWHLEYDKLRKTIRQMGQSEHEKVQQKINVFKQKLRWIEEVIS